MTSTTFSGHSAPLRIDPDRLGVVASVLCAVHCAVTPLFLLFAPSFGRVWSHPASHWIVAVLVVPLASIMVVRGFRQHRQKWVVACGIVGVGLVLVGAAIPYLEDRGHVTSSESASEEDFVYVVGEEEGTADEPAEAGHCADSCCPSIVTKADGGIGLHIPAASIVTTLGGLALIVTHLGNLCGCAACGKRSSTAPHPL